MEKNKIDYTELNDRIVMQAIEKANFHMDKDMLARLLQGKIARAQAMMDIKEKQLVSNLD